MRSSLTMPASDRRAIADILACRTEALGAHLWRCDQCSHEVFSYHFCKSRSCPKCHTKQTKDWLDARKDEMLPTDYFRVTITVPQELRALLRANQRDGYTLLLVSGAQRPSHGLGHAGWRQTQNHAHQQAPRPGRPRCRLGPSPGSSTSTIGGRSRRRAALSRTMRVPRAITNTRIVALDDPTVTIRYKERKSSRWRTCRMPGHEFVRRFLQHVLPKGLHKVRYFGLWDPSKRQHAARARLLLELERTTPPTTETAASSLLKVAHQSPDIATEPRP